MRAHFKTSRGAGDGLPLKFLIAQSTVTSVQYRFIAFINRVLQTPSFPFMSRIIAAGERTCPSNLAEKRWRLQQEP